MTELLADRPPWFLAGAALGLVVVSVLALVGERVGVLGGYSEVVERLSGRSHALRWKAWFLLGIIAGGLLFAALGAGARLGDGYGWLSREVGRPAVATVLVCAGILIGYGAKTAGGCTSGHGLGGNSFGSRASFVATGTFMATAVAGAFVTRWLLGS